MAHLSIRHLKHIHRLHTIVFRMAAIVLILSTSGLFFIVQQTNAHTMFAKLSIGVTEEVTPEPPVAIVDTGGTGGVSGHHDAPEPPVMPPPPPTIPDEGEAPQIDAHVTLDGVSATPESIPHIANVRPVFKGKAPVPFAFFVLELHSNTVITTTFNAGADGSWEWSPPHDLELGQHTLFITVFDPTGKTKIGEATLNFEVTRSEEGATVTDNKSFVVKQPVADIKPPQSLFAQKKPLFDIKTTILSPKPVQIRSGDKIYAQISLMNIGALGEPVNATVNYQILDNALHKVIIEESESIVVATQLSYLKTFDTSTSLEPGDYSINTTVTYDGVEAHSSDDFTVTSTAMAPVIASTHINISKAGEFLSVLVLLSLFIMYHTYHSAETMQHMMRQVTERDLKKQGLV